MNENKEKLFLRRQIFYLLIIIGTFLIVACYYFYIDIKMRDDFFNNFISEITSTAISIIILGWGYQIYTENESKKIMKQEIVETIQLNDRNVLDAFSIAKKEKFIETNIKSIIGEKYGTLLFDGMIKKYVNENVTYRENLDYYGEFVPINNNLIFADLLELNSSKYFKLNQRVTYKKHFIESVDNIEFKLVFAFNEKSLDFWLKDNSVFWREIMNFEGIDEVIKKLDHVQLLNFFTNFAHLRIWFFNENDEANPIENEFIIKFIDNSDTKAIELSLTNQAIKKYFFKSEQKITYKCRVFFSIPYLKEFRRFHFILPEPTINTKFTVRFNQQISNIDYVSYLTDNTKGFNQEYDAEFHEYTITTTDITFPRSGIVFFWE